jgi:WD40 repeat protein
MNSQFPYPGLRPFDSTETDIFFGREEQVDELLEKLEETRFLAIIGPSGCGKSSLVRTGLFTGLRACFLSDACLHWKIATMRPGNRPFANLAEALLEPSILGETYASYTEHTEAFASLQASLNRGSFSLHEILQEFPLPNGQLLILVDQFEELFRFYQQGNVNETAAFVTLLLNSSQYSHAPTQNEGETRIYVVITMRSDFIGDCALFHGLPEAINQGLYLTPRLTHDQLREAIELPATVFGGQIEPALITRLLNEVGNNPDQLPLLQHLLMRMWTLGAKKEGSITLTLENYEEIGGLKNALSQHVDEALAELEPCQRKIAEILFRSLSGGDNLHRDTRRPVKLKSIAEIAQESWQTVAAIVEVFRKEGRSFLMPQGQALVADTVIDISHESLIRQWQQLKKWTQKEAEDAELYQRLESSARRWKKRQAALWRTPELEFALNWRDKTKPTMPWAKRYGKEEGKHFELAIRFLAESEKEQQREQRQKEVLLEEKERALQEEEAARRRKLRQARRQMIGAVIGFILAIGLTFWAFWEREHAIQLENKAILAQKQAEKLSINLLDSQITHAALLATRAGDYANARKVLNENSKLYQNIPKYRLHARDLLVWFNELMGGEPQQIYKDKNIPLYTVAVSPNGLLLAAAGKKGTLLIFDIKSGEVRYRLKGHKKSIWTIVFHPEGKWLASAGDDKRILFWSLKTGQKIMEWEAPDEVNALAVSPDGCYLASGGKDKNVTLWKITTGKKWHIFRGHTDSISIGGIAFHPTKELLLTGSFDDTARLWDIKTKETLHILRGHTDDIANVIFSPDGETLGTSSDDKMIRLWDVHSGKMLRLLHGHHRKILGLRFITASRLISASRDGTLRIWDSDSGMTLRVLQGHQGPATYVVHAGQIFSASFDGTVMRWNADLPFQQIIDLPSAAISSEIAPDGKSVAVGFGDGALRLYSTSNGDLLWEQKDAHKQRIRHLTFNTEGNLLATASFDKTAKLWQVIKEGNELREEQIFIGHTDQLYSVGFSPDSRILASSSYSGEIALLTIETKESRFYKAHEDIATSVIFDSSGTRLLSAGADGHVYLWDINNNPPTILQAFFEQDDNLAWASFSPDEKRIAAVGRRHLIYIYTKEGQEYRLRGHKSTIYRAIFSHDGEQLATVCADATVRFWDLNSGDILFSLRLPTSINDNNGYPTPLWDFDFHCTTDVCRIAVPLTRGKLLLYEMRI